MYDLCEAGAVSLHENNGNIVRKKNHINYIKDEMSYRKHHANVPIDMIKTPPDSTYFYIKVYILGSCWNLFFETVLQRTNGRTLSQ